MTKGKNPFRLNARSTLTKICGIAYDKRDINRIVKFCNKHNFRYYYIKHKKEEEEEKNHYHFIIESDSQHRFRVSSLLTDTFTINLFQQCSNVSSYLRYMTHIDYTFKIHYEIDNIISNVPTLCVETLVEEANPNKPNKEEVKNLEFLSVINAIEEYNFTMLSQIISYCIENGIIYKTQWTYTLNSLLKERKCIVSCDKKEIQIFKN